MFIIAKNKNKFNNKNYEDIKKYKWNYWKENKLFKDITRIKKNSYLHYSNDYPIYPLDQDDLKDLKIMILLLMNQKIKKIIQ